MGAEFQIKRKPNILHTSIRRLRLVCRKLSRCVPSTPWCAFCLRQRAGPGVMRCLCRSILWRWGEQSSRNFVQALCLRSSVGV